jgi:hypothetical protein
MPRMTRSHQAGGAVDRARRAAARARPLARSTGAAVRSGVRAARARAAPQAERTGQVLNDTIAPAVAGLLSSAAQRLEPATPPRRRWRKLAGISVLAAAASAAAAAVLSRKPGLSAAEAEADTDEADTDEADTGDLTPPPQTSNGQARHSADAATDTRVRSS